MISHTIPASGVAGVIKLALALYHRVLPPTLNVSEPNPKLELETTPFYLNTETRPWIQGGSEPRRAGVNAFGFGGINAHAVLEEMPAKLPLDHLPPWETEVCILEGESPAAVVEQALRLVERLEPPAATFSLADLAYTLNCGSERKANVARLAIVATSLDDLRTKLHRAVDKLQQPDCRRIKDISGIYYEAEPLGRDGKIVLVFPGEGAQYPNMLADLCLHFPEVREAFDRADRSDDDEVRGYVTSDWVFPRPAFSEDERRAADEHLMQMDIAVEAVLTANRAIHELLQRIGLRPDACMGHSTGEYSAAHAAGVLVVENEEQFMAIRRGMRRCYSAAESRDDLPKAVLLAVAADRDRVEAIARETEGELFVAMDNCPHQAVLVGERTVIDRAREIANRDGLIYGELPYDRAVHTPLFGTYADELREVFADTVIGPATTALYSCTTESRYPEDPAAVRDLFVDHWTRPVEFRRTIEKLYDEGARVFIEAGPRGNMTGFIDDIFRGRPYCAVPADLQRRSGTTQLNHLVGMLTAHDVPLDLTYLYEHRKAKQVVWDDLSDSAPPRRHADVPLALSWPQLRLSDDALDRLGGGAPTRFENIPPEPEQADTPDEAEELLVPLSFARSPAGNGTALQAADELSFVMDAHVATMERFLTMHEEIMQVYLAEPESAPQSAVVVEAVQTASPLLGDVVDRVAGESLVARRVFDPAEDLYLRDHALGRAVSTTDPTLSALMVMPLTMSLEILAEAASSLVPGRRVTGLREVRAHRWITCDDAPKTLEIVAERVSSSEDGDRVHVTLYDEPATVGNADVPRAPVVEATVLLAERYPEPPPARAAQGETQSRWTSGSLYGDEMFHGPCWQGVRAVEKTGPQGSLARLEVLPFSRLFRSTHEPNFALDPIVLDAAGQVIGFWTAEHLDNGRVVFPFRLEALDVYGPLRPQGDELTCTTAIELIGDQLVRSDIDVIDPAGRLWMRLTGWEDKRFDVPTQFHALTRVSKSAPISEEWTLPIAGYPGDGLLECRRLDAALRDRAFWKDVWSHRILSRWERGEFRALDLPEARALEWLGARTAAKEAVQRLVRHRYGVELLPADIEIYKDDEGRPLVGGTWAADIPVVPVVSLAHTRGCAVALAALGGRIGIDIELVRPRQDGFADIAFANAERELLHRLPPDMLDEWILRCWCAKEAVAKALGSGMARGPQGLSVISIDVEKQRIHVRLGDAMANDHQHPEATAFVVHSYRQDDLVVATTLCELEGDDDDRA